MTTLLRPERAPMVHDHPAARSPTRLAVDPTGEGEGRLLIVSNRLPLSVALDGDRPVVRRSAGGLATGLLGPHERGDGLWFGWSGATAPLGDEDAREVRHQFEAARAVTVPLSADEVETYYERLSNGVLWPVFHDRLDQLPVRIGGWDVYEAVNARFADAVAAHYRPGDVIWVHDYQLMRLPALLRARLPEARIGFFLHIPFPSPSIFASLPRREWLAEGMLGADLIGFHTRRYRDQFAETLRQYCGASVERDDTEGGVVVGHRGHAVRLGVFPIGADAARLAARAADRDVTERTLELRHPTQRVVLGIDRLDYSKGIVRRLLAFESLLTAHPEWVGRVRLIQIAAPSRGGVGAYRRLREEVEALVGRINGAFGTPTWTPVQYIHRTVGERTLLALYRAADVMLVTPVRDGMNLVAKEFAAARADEAGVLVLSEFAGAADELRDALLVNPYDVEAVAAAIHRALVMEGAERRTRMRRLRAQVLEHDVHAWAESFLDTLRGLDASA